MFKTDIWKLWIKEVNESGGIYKYRWGDNEIISLFAHFIQGHFLPHKQEKYNPPKNGVLNYFKAHNNKSYLSMIYDKNNFKLIGTMSTRPLDCYIDDKKLPLYYVDFLCVHQKLFLM